jgi:hypothetical protein
VPAFANNHGSRGRFVVDRETAGRVGRVVRFQVDFM